MKVLQFTCLSLGLALCQPAAAALNFYVTLEANGLVIEGEPVVQIMGKDEVNTKIEGQSFDLQITNDDGRVTHGNIRIIKRVNKSSPLLHKALDESANILAEIWFYRRNPDTSLIERDQTWTLTGGRITSISRGWWWRGLRAVPGGHNYQLRDTPDRV